MPLTRRARAVLVCGAVSVVALAALTAPLSTLRPRRAHAVRPAPPRPATATPATAAPATKLPATTEPQRPAEAAATAPPPPAPRPEYDWLPPADDDDVARLVAAAETEAAVGPNMIRRMVEAARDGRPDSAFGAGDDSEVAALLDALGPRAVPAALRALLVRDAALARGMAMWREPRHDAGSYPLAWHLRERLDARGDATLLVMLADESLHVQTRIEAAVALCRRGGPADEIADLVTDVHVDHDVRNRIAQRLPRLGNDLPERLHEALLLPFGQVDRTVALVLLAAGDGAAPRFAVAAFRAAAERSSSVGHDDSPLLGIGLDGVALLLAADPDAQDVLARARRQLDERLSARPRPPSDEEWPAVPDLRDTLLELADRADAWIDAHGELCATPFERAQEAYRASPDRERERRCLDTDALATLGEDIDVAAAALGVYTWERRALASLERLHRIAEWLRPRVAAEPTPRAKLALMQDLLVPAHVSLNGSEDLSSLTQFTDRRAGVCITFVTAFVALGDRLGLPLHAVHVPGHVYLRWDDGTTVFNFDPTRGGADVPDRDYVAELCGEEAAADWRRHVRDLSRRGLISTNLSNASAYFGTGDFPNEDNLRNARRAVRLDPANAEGWNNLALVGGLLGPAHEDELRRAVERLEDLGCVDAKSRALQVRSLVRVARPDLALALLDTLPPDVVDDTDVRTARAMALSVAGRTGEALALAEELRADDPDSLDLQTTELYCRLRDDLDDGLARLRAAYGAPHAALDLHMSLAMRFLCASLGDAASERLAWKLIDPFYRTTSANAPAWDGRSALWDRSRVVPCTLFAGVRVAVFRRFVHDRVFDAEHPENE